MNRFLFNALEPLSLFRKGLMCLLSLSAALIVVVLYILFSTTGLKLTVDCLSYWTPYTFQYEQLEGRLIDRIYVKNLVCEGPQFRLDANILQLHYRFSDLFAPQPLIKGVQGKGLQLLLKQKKSSQQDLPKLASLWDSEAAIPLPLKWAPGYSIKQIFVEDFTVDWGGTPYHAEQLIVQSKKTEDSYELSSVYYAGNLGKLQGYFDHAITLDWDLNLPQHSLSTQGTWYFPNRIIHDPKNKLALYLTLDKTEFAGHHLENINLALSGTHDKHTALLTGSLDHHAFTGKVFGILNQNTWEGHLFEWHSDAPRVKDLAPFEAKTQLSFDKEHVTLQLDSQLGPKLSSKLVATVETEAPYRLSGEIHQTQTKLKHLAALFPALADQRGEVSGDFNLSGHLFAPEFTGRCTLRDMSINPKVWGTKGSLDMLTVDLKADQQLALQGHGTWGNGPFQCNGQGSFKTKSPDIRVHLSGQSLRLCDTTEYQVVGSPELDIILSEGRATVTGTCHIPQATIEPLQKTTLKTRSQDVTIRSAPKQAKPTTASSSLLDVLESRITLTLGDNIRFKGYGLTSRVTGQLELHQQPQQPPKGRGELQIVEGKYRAYGKIFDIAQGKLMFSGGPLLDPILHIRAQRKITTAPDPTVTAMATDPTPIIVGVQLSGPVKTPKISLYATPNLSDQDIMSYLVVGRPQNALSDSQAEILLQAARQVAGLLGNHRKDVHWDLAEKLKLDHIALKKKSSTVKSALGNPLEDSVLTLGKQLSDRLYLHYSLGLADTTSMLGLRYLMGKHVILEANAGTQASSADVLFTFESN